MILFKTLALLLTLNFIQTGTDFDILTKRAYIRQNDVYSLDVTKFIDFYRNSLDFSCSNPKVKVPGVPDPDLTVHEEGIVFNFSESKFGYDYIMGIREN